MTDLNEKDSVQLISQPAHTHQPQGQLTNILPTIEDHESIISLTPTLDDGAPVKEPSPFSAFYNPTPTRRSVEASKSESRANMTLYPSAYDTDCETGLSQQKTLASSSQQTIASSYFKKPCTQDDAVWPGQNAVKMRQKAEKKQRLKKSMCGCMAGFSKKTRIYIKIGIACVIIGAAVAVGLGISKAVGGGVWKNANNGV